ncbi:MAG: choice-of-anchor D domain-containing protein, partial [Pirellulaceae bacterium]|nr:choice-of-anchor D domain-containing protein [Pirellulaceae bacterium]
MAESLAALPLLSSRPSATAKLFLDFNGHFQASWGSWSNVTTPVFDTDGDATTFSSGELSTIQQIWARVAEDFAPFNIDVTTIDPGSLANKVVAHIAIGGGSYDWYGRSAGGVAYVGGFYNSAPNVGYVFENNLGNGNAKYVAEAASHEAGHLFGLQHQAKWSGTTLVESYNSGGNGWAPIMGLGYYQERTTWHNGTTSFGSTSYQDDLAILAGSNNAFGYLPDDFGNTRNTSAPLATSGDSFQVSGLIGRHDDIDVFSFTTLGGEFSFQLAVNSVGPNLDATLEVWSTTGIVTSAAPTNSLGASLTASLGAGTYYLVARSQGDYGNMGQYTLTGTLSTNQVAPEITVLNGTTSLTSGQTVDFGSSPQGTDISRTFTVRNDGTATLNLVPLDPQSLPAGFQLVSNLGASLLAPGASTSLTVRLDGSAPGTFGGVLSIVNDDANENPFELILAGKVLAPDTSPPSAQFAAIVPNPRNSPVGRLELTFNESVSGVNLADLRLTRNGQPVDLAGSLLTGTGTSYTVDLANFTAAEGAYALTLIASGSGIVDGAGNALVADATVTWTTDTTRPSAQFAAVVPNPRNSPVGSVALTFSEVVTGVNLADLRLTRNGQSVSLTGNVLTGSGANYILDLANFTAAEGNYVLTLVAGNSGIVDGVGNSLGTNASVAWSTDTTAPTVQFGQVAPNPRNSAVGLLEVVFSEAVIGLDLADFEITRG